jgi:hypothetical protein
MFPVTLGGGAQTSVSLLWDPDELVSVDEFRDGSRLRRPRRLPVPTGRVWPSWSPSPRLLGTDQDGLLVIGCTGNMARRYWQSRSAGKSANGSSR